MPSSSRPSRTSSAVAPVTPRCSSAGVITMRVTTVPLVAVGRRVDDRPAALPVDERDAVPGPLDLRRRARRPDHLVVREDHAGAVEAVGAEVDQVAGGRLLALQRGGLGHLLRLGGDGGDRPLLRHLPQPEGRTGR
jgi:hypothetical protein